MGKPVDGWKMTGAAEACRCILHGSGQEVLGAQKEKVRRSWPHAES